MKIVQKKFIRRLFQMVPEGRAKCWLRGNLGKLKDGVPLCLLVNSADVVVMVGVHRIDTVTEVSALVGVNGQVVVIEAVPKYLENIRDNLDNYMSWPLKNIVYISKGVAAHYGKATIEIGQSAAFNKLSGHGIFDESKASDYVDTLEIETDSLDSILEHENISKVDFIYMTISGMELNALHGMQRIMSLKGLRMMIRSLHRQDGQLIYPQVVNKLKENGFDVVLGKKHVKFEGTNVYACKC
jgi:FkbM family methyltransferase